MKSDTYTRQQIVRKLRRLRDKENASIQQCGDNRRNLGICPACVECVARISGLNLAIAAFPPAKEK